MRVKDFLAVDKTGFMAEPQCVEKIGMRGFNLQEISIVSGARLGPPGVLFKWEVVKLRDVPMPLKTVASKSTKKRWFFAFNQLQFNLSWQQSCDWKCRVCVCVSKQAQDSHWIYWRFEDVFQASMKGGRPWVTKRLAGSGCFVARTEQDDLLLFHQVEAAVKLRDLPMPMNTSLRNPKKGRVMLLCVFWFQPTAVAGQLHWI